MSVADNQGQVFLQLLQTVRPHLRTDRALPERINRLLARDKRFGSRDRRLYRELLYTALRFWPWIESVLESEAHRAIQRTAWLAADSRDTARFRESILTDWPPCPESLEAKADYLKTSTNDLLPDWFKAECPAALETRELDFLHRRAALWLRLQTDTPDRVWQDFAAQGWSHEIFAALPDAVRLSSEIGVAASESYFSGLFEIQDLGSQLVLAMHDIQPGGHWLDACAGAGGKTLQLARLLGSTGHVTAHDIRSSALNELVARARRAKLGNISIITQPTDESYDGVLIDAPCSGSGTWRRSPHLKWSTSTKIVAEHALIQLQLLEQFASQVKAGGQLIYATCSLNESENGAVIREFLESHPEFTPSAPANDFGYPAGSVGTTIMPARHDTDGFYTCCLRRG